MNKKESQKAHIRKKRDGITKKGPLSIHAESRSTNILSDSYVVKVILKHSKSGFKMINLFKHKLKSKTWTGLAKNEFSIWEPTRFIRPEFELKTMTLQALVMLHSLFLPCAVNVICHVRSEWHAAFEKYFTLFCWWL